MHFTLVTTTASPVEAYHVILLAGTAVFFTENTTEEIWYSPPLQHDAIKMKFGMEQHAMVWCCQTIDGVLLIYHIGGRAIAAMTNKADEIGRGMNLL